MDNDADADYGGHHGDDGEVFVTMRLTNDGNVHDIDDDSRNDDENK